jgi:hypothetical protein
MLFDKVICKEAAMDLIRPAYYFSGSSCLAEEMSVEVMCKEYGDDDDWIGLTVDDYENVKNDNHYRNFEIWYNNKD